MGWCAGPPRLDGAHRRRRGTRGHGPTGVGHGRARTPRPRRGRPRARRRRSGHHREPPLAPLEPGSGGRGGGGLRRAPDGAAPPRPAVAASPPGPPPAAAGRRRMGARDHQRAEPTRAGGPRDRGQHDLQRLRPGSGPGRPGRRRAPPPASPMAHPCCCSRRARWRARTSRGASPSPRRWAPPTGSSVRRRTGTDPSSSAWSHGPAAPSSSARPWAAAPLPTPTPRVMSWRSPRSGRASATRRWSRRPTGAPWPSARTRWRGSWRRSASSGSTSPTPVPWPSGCANRTIASSNTTRHVAADHFNLADLPGRLSEVLRRVPGL